MNESARSMRAATRHLVRELKIIEGNGCLPGFRLAESHVLYEIARAGQTTVSELTEILLLEKSHVSRLVATLRRQGLVSARPSNSDGRQRLLAVTPQGKRRVEQIDQMADAQVESAFEYLTAQERQTAIDALARYGKALAYARRAAEIHTRLIEPRDDAAMAGVIRSVMTEFGAVGCGYSIEDPEVDALYETYRQPRARYWVIEMNGQVLGGGGIGPLKGDDPHTCELQKMYFMPELRGRGLGVPMIKRCLEAAREFGYRRCYLETLDHMQQARSLYRRMGFRDLDAPEGETGHYKCNSWMALDL